ncbi:hypothetical protein BCV69DRAFT_131418 [Microstroma glucosiphilum]|uniref:Uncharacterized protein n=1 Tax=Pseudomicrostroma glucosiphilum TaxID=1684307 RepID=A0A316TXV0_9BASI|nr:hypothetical protein BCV69DRAFT_131418 [Pseudomicrostroma glucosiphilum]PWN17658.1 hypothetical protein BCV69DRAFT_131418 [Pseudomicrostroma glucosiphilum]
MSMHSDAGQYGSKSIAPTPQKKHNEAVRSGGCCASCVSSLLYEVQLATTALTALLLYLVALSALLPDHSSLKTSASLLCRGLRCPHSSPIHLIATYRHSHPLSWSNIPGAGKSTKPRRYGCRHP